MFFSPTGGRVHQTSGTALRRPGGLVMMVFMGGLTIANGVDMASAVPAGTRRGFSGPSIPEGPELSVLTGRIPPGRDPGDPGGPRVRRSHLPDRPRNPCNFFGPRKWPTALDWIPRASACTRETLNRLDSRRRRQRRAGAAAHDAPPRTAGNKGRAVRFTRDWCVTARR